MQTDIKLSRAHIFKIIQSGEVLGSLLSKLPGPLMKVAVPLAKKYFSSFTNYSCCLSNWCRNSKTKQKKTKKKLGSGTTILNEWHYENCSSSWGF